MTLCPLRLDIDSLEATSPAIIDSAMLKRHCRIDFDDDNDLLNLYVNAAVLWAEGVTHRTIFRRGHSWVLKHFPDFHPPQVRLPRGKTYSVDSIEYSSGGIVNTLYGPSSDVSPAGDDYQEDLRGDSGGVLWPLRGYSWPSVDRDVPAPVAINFTAGWSYDDIPSDLLYAVMFGIADCYDMRGSFDLGDKGPRLETRMSLLSGWCLPRVY